MSLKKKSVWVERKDGRKILHIFGLRIKFHRNKLALLRNELRTVHDELRAFREGFIAYEAALKAREMAMEQRLRQYAAGLSADMQTAMAQGQIAQNEYLASLLRAGELHRKVFPKYRGINQGRDVVLIATGPSLKRFVPIEDAVYVGVNRSFEYDKVRFDYLFLQDNSGPTQEYINAFVRYPAQKFMGYIPHYISTACLIPEKYSTQADVEYYCLAHPSEKRSFAFDLASEPLGDAYSIVFPAMQFILWTKPRRVYLVGCDCNCGGYHAEKDGSNVLATDAVLDGWKRMKDFAAAYYPDTEIISINPVGLKGLFKDV